MLNVACRMLGSVRAAEDIVGEAYTRLVAHGLHGIGDRRGWLITVTSRLCLNRLRSFEVSRRSWEHPTRGRSPQRGRGIRT